MLQSIIGNGIFGVDPVKSAYNVAQNDLVVSGNDPGGSVLCNGNGTYGYEGFSLASNIATWTWFLASGPDGLDRRARVLYLENFRSFIFRVHPAEDNGVNKISTEADGTATAGRVTVSPAGQLVIAATAMTGIDNGDPPSCVGVSETLTKSS